MVNVERDTQRGKAIRGAPGPDPRLDSIGRSGRGWRAALAVRVASRWGGSGQRVGGGRVLAARSSDLSV